MLATLLSNTAKRNNFTNINNIKIIWSKLACSIIWIGIILMFDFKCCLCHLWLCESFRKCEVPSKVENVPVRRALVSAFIMVVSMGISFVGLTNVVKYGYGYCGYLGIAIIIVPLLTVGFYKNRKFMKENSQDAKVSFEEVYEEN